MEHHLERNHSTLKIALIGYGKMGKAVHVQAKNFRTQVAVIISSQSDFSQKNLLDGAKNADIWIDFSKPDAVLHNVQLAVSLNKSMVMGTTGWHESYSEIEHIVNESSIGFLHSPNFSIGVALFFQLIEKANALFRPFKEYDIGGIETHHKKKIDTPSGTAKLIEEKMNAQLEEGRDPLQFSSIRIGNVPGTHTLIFDSQEDSITLTHEARNRDGFAKGALLAAKWLQGKKGIYTLNDMIHHESLKDTKISQKAS